MKTYRADLHIHTTLSPCGSLFMSPMAIIEQALSQQLDVIAITDHNSTRQAPLIKKMAKANGLFVLCGAEVTTREEVHVLCLFETDADLNTFQHYLDENLPNIPNNPDLFGYQVQVDENEDIVYEEERLLISALNQSIDQVEAKVHALNGLFIPAHINKSKNGIISQLGFVPPDLKCDAFELSQHITIDAFLLKNKYLQGQKFIQSSDAHQPDDVGTVFTELVMDELSFLGIKNALRITV